MKKFLKGACTGALAGICAVSLAACGNNGKSTLLGSPAAAVSLSYAQQQEESYKTFLESTDVFASKLASAAYADYEGDNFAVSPVSVYMALSLAARCAGGETRAELLNALGVSYEQLYTYYSYLYRSLNVEYTDANEKVIATLKTGNSIWVNDGAAVNTPCIESLADDFYAYSYSADFRNDNENANKAVRAFVKEHTNGLIDRDFELSDETVFTLINTLYLKDIWNSIGSDLSFTADNYNFKNADGSEKSLKLLSGYYNSGRAVAEESFSTFFTTTNHGYKLKFIVPNAGYAVDDVFTAENIAYVNSLCDFNAYDEANNKHYNTRCLFPEFEASYGKDVKEILQDKFGISALFSRNDCDFSELTPDAAYVNSVQHVAKLTVNKKGIEGAAATAIDGASSAEPPEWEEVYEDFIVDKAFGFILTDPYGVTLFSGVVNKI